MFIAFLSVSRIHSDKLCLLAFAAFVNALRSSSFSRMGTILPFAWPFGSRGLPTLLVFFFALTVLLNYRNLNCRLWRIYGRDM